MRWKGREQSKNVEDRRGVTPAMAVGGGGLLMMLIVGIAFLFDPRLGQQLLQQQQQQQAQAQKQAPAGQARKPGEPDNEGDFIKVVLRDTETVWTRLFKEGVQGGTYQPPQLVMFSGSVQSRCGMATADVGPFYCPGDQKVYIDPTFFTELEKRHKAGGEFARAYVIAHEVAHHVQKLLGFSDKVDAVRARGNQVETNRASVRLELQADYLAGVWAHHAHKEYNILEPGDIESGINAANRIGDDTLMKEATGRAIPERYTHGTSEQRMRWFTKGLKSGELEGCTQLFEIPYEDL